jgi:hypothetical protein
MIPYGAISLTDRIHIDMDGIGVTFGFWVAFADGGP